MSHERQGDRFARSTTHHPPSLRDELMRGLGVDDVLSGHDHRQAQRTAEGSRFRVLVLSADEVRARALADKLGGITQVAEHAAAALPVPVTQLKGSTLDLVTGPRDALVLIDADEPAAELAACVRRLCKGRRKLAVAFAGPRATGANVDLVLRAGARGYIPKHLEPAALSAAVRYILAGQKFRPYAHDHDDSIAAKSDKIPPAGKGSNLRAEQPLTAAEMEVLRLVSQHLTDREIAEARGTQRGTVCIQVQSIKRKLGCKRRSELIEIYRRLYELDDQRVQIALSGGPVDTAWLVDLMHCETRRRGQTLFRQGELARRMYYLESGEITLPEIGIRMKSGELLGEIGIFAPDNKRTHTAVCATDVKLRYLDSAQVWRFYQLKPQFAIQMQCLIMRRLQADISRLRQ